MTSLKTKSPKRFGFSAVAGALVLALWLATPIAAPAQTFNVLFSFDFSDGQGPWLGLVQGRDGLYYGMTWAGGVLRGCQLSEYDPGCGTVFKITQGGKLTTVYKFRNGTDGANPNGGLVLATDGNFYGTTQMWQGQPNTVFKITPGGTLTTLYTFSDGWLGTSSLVQAANGSLYGTTSNGGANGQGTVYKITRAGNLTTLYSFCAQPNCADGEEPGAGVVQATDGNFYGTTSAGGANGCGTVFKITPSGTLTTLHTFNGTDGCSPAAPLLQASGGNLYGTSAYGGANGQGTVFRITRAGKLTTLYSFCAQPNCADGEEPGAGVVQATDGNFYGTTTAGGANSVGTLFNITPSGSLTTLHSFDGGDGLDPGGGTLLQATDGNLYGTAFGGGSFGYDCGSEANGCGTIFSLDMGLGPFVAFVRDSGKVGANVQILGQGFTGTTGVSFNGTAASFTVHSDTYLTAIVPNGATTGYVTVTTPGGTLQSNVKFLVRQ